MLSYRKFSVLIFPGNRPDRYSDLSDSDIRLIPAFIIIDFFLISTGNTVGIFKLSIGKYISIRLLILIAGHFSAIVDHVYPAEYEDISFLYFVAHMHLRNPGTGHDTCYDTV